MCVIGMMYSLWNSNHCLSVRQSVTDGGCTCVCHFAVRRSRNGLKFINLENLAYHSLHWWFMWILMSHQQSLQVWIRIQCITTSSPRTWLWNVGNNVIWL